jgi:hypothetical protein
MPGLGWDAYLAQHASKPMALLVDLDVRANAPDPGLPWLQRVRITLRDPDDNGFPGDVEAPKLNAIESTILADEALEALGLRYVGRATWNGMRDLFLYGPTEDSGEVVADQVRRALPDNTVEYFSMSDPNWGAYIEFLFPDADSLQTIMNHRVLEQLRMAGDDMVTPRDIDHWAYFADAERRDAFIADTAHTGFRATERVLEEGADYPYGVKVTRHDSPALDHINDVVLYLFHVVQRHEGMYDGWETAIVQGK